MRISNTEKNCIVNAIGEVDNEAPIWLFGSRTDDTKKGGDIDIAVLSKKIGITEKIRIKRSICNKIGEQRIDLLVSDYGNEAVFKSAVENGIRLNEQESP
ncbi:MAG: nucleotidyltransferase domain-containing protein [Treponema sp.]|jgi:predicted nucleotidyltransferase|nr:nucleotidyltransferase domain-containing protein [Treponema sp.]